MQPLISVLIAAASPVSRAGLSSLVRQMPQCEIAGSTCPAGLLHTALELQPGVILWQLDADEDAAAILHRLDRIPTVVVTGQAGAELIRAGARAALSLNASETQIAIAIEAAAADLVVLPWESTTGPAAPQAASGLTARETQILQLIAEGLANKEIAHRLGISDHTVKFHVSAVLGKLGAGSRAEAIGMGIRLGAIML